MLCLGLMVLMCCLSVGVAEETWQDVVSTMMPGYTVLAAQPVGESWLLLLDKPHQVGRVLAACWRDAEENGWQLISGTTMPASATMEERQDGFWLRLYDTSYQIGSTGERQWGIVGIDTGTERLSLGAQWMGQGDWGLQNRQYGRHPWSDITQMDWNSLPRAMAEVQAKLDPSGWAMVANPDAADRLHLRLRPEVGAYSLGRYANGTPLQVLSTTRQWVRVSIGGTEGWMKRSYVAEGYAMQGVSSALVVTTVEENAADRLVYRTAGGGESMAELTPETPVAVLGMVGEEWCHVLLLASDAYGYVRVDALKTVP